MARMALRTKVNEDKTEATIELHMDGKQLGHIILNASDLEGLIWDLATQRMKMVEEVSPTLDPGSRVVSFVDPGWSKPGRHPPEGKALAFRHPGFGWVSFFFPQQKAEAIAAELMKPPEIAADGD